MATNNLKGYFYSFSAISSGVCLCLMLLLIAAQVFARLTGSVIPSSEDFSGWLLSATFFFGLAFTFKNGGHIRMTILLSKLSKKDRYRQEFINILIGLLITGYLAFYCSFTVYESFTYKDVTDTYVVLPLWIVQLPMAIGSLFLFIAMVDGFTELLGNKLPSFSLKESNEV